MLRPLLASLAPLLLVACADASIADGGDDEPTPVALADVLAEPLTASIRPAAAAHGSTAAIEATHDDDVSKFELDVAGGEVMVQFAGDQLVLRGLAVEVGDLEIPAHILPQHGAVLTDLGFELTHEIAARPVILEDEVMIADVLARGAIHWSIVKDGVAIDLADVQLDDLYLIISVTLEDERPVVRVSGGQSGTLWTWLDHFAFENLDLSLVAEPGVVVE